MTQPIQEPTLARAQRAQKYGIDQLFRRPCVPCGGDMDYARITFDSSEDAPIAVPDSTVIPITPMTSGFTTDPAVLQIDLAQGRIEWDLDQIGRPAVASAQVLWDGNDADYPGYRLVRFFGEGGFPSINELNGDNFPGDLAWQTSSLDWYLHIGEEIGIADVQVYHEMGGSVNVLYAEINMFVWPVQEVTDYPEVS